MSLPLLVLGENAALLYLTSSAAKFCNSYWGIALQQPINEHSSLKMHQSNVTTLNLRDAEFQLVYGQWVQLCIPMTQSVHCTCL